MPGAFRTAQRPDDEVVSLLEQALASARDGHIRTIAITVVNPVNDAQVLFGGDLSSIRTNALLGALTRAIHSLIAG